MGYEKFKKQNWTAYTNNDAEVEVDFDFDEENYDGEDHLSMNDPEATDTADMGVVVDVSNDPDIIPANLSYDEIVIITQ
jgi:hypothetical protein